MRSRRRAVKHRPTDSEAQRLTDVICTLGDYRHVNVRAQRGHLLIYAGDVEPVARLTPLSAGHYALSFRKHTGRWEPMPFAGELTDIAEVLVGTLGIYLQRWDFQDSKSGSDH